MLSAPTSAVYTVNATAIQPDGKIVALGRVNGQIGVTRLNADGTLDTTFNGTGTATIPINNAHRIVHFIKSSTSRRDFAGHLMIQSAERDAGNCTWLYANIRLRQRL